MFSPPHPMLDDFTKGKPMNRKLFWGIKLSVTDLKYHFKQNCLIIILIFLASSNAHSSVQLLKDLKGLGI